MRETIKLNSEQYFYTWEEAEEFFNEYYDKIEEHINLYGSSHFIGFFTSYINGRSSKEDNVPSIHSDMASMCWDLYFEDDMEV